ncbi:MAG: alkaline phosphatase family protein, partial [bacterium]
MPTRTATRLLIVGWDAADWILINRLFAAGKMPVLRRLVDAGCRADLGTLEPKLSPLLWSSIATGKTADKHGILNFVEPKPEGGGLRVSTSTSRKAKALWNILSQSGLETRVV